jgi:hypothetical protein
MTRRLPGLFSLLGLLCAFPAAAQQMPAASPAPAPQVRSGGNAEFLKATDEVLAEMSRILGLPVKETLKRSLRSRDEIRAYLIQEMNEDREPAKRHADDKTLEAFGLIPRGFPLDSFMLDLLTDQVAGLYDPKAKEFYIADWIPADEQRTVMAHELTHALDDQYFHIDSWSKAARPNDDAELARDAVVEGSAVAAMLDYTLREQKMGVRDLPDVSALMEGSALGEMEKDPMMAKAPPFLRDELVFPYLAGMSFTQQVLKANSGWADFRTVFEHPPVSTQQILHPELYLAGVKPAEVTLPDFAGIVPGEWKNLEENHLGEFGLGEVLKQFLGKERTGKSAAAWAGDRYAVFENEKTKQTLLVYRVRLDNAADAKTVFSDYSEALEAKYKRHTVSVKRPGFLQFETGEGVVSLRCVGADCLSVEGASREVFEKITKAIGWPPEAAASEAPKPSAGVAVHN